MKKVLSWKTAAYFLLILLGAFWIFPIVGTIFISFKPLREIQLGHIWILPRNLEWRNYVEGWSRLKPYFINNMIITIPSAIASVFFASLGAYGVGIIRSRLSTPLFYFLIAGIAIPFHISLIPLFELMKILGLLDTYLAQILTHIAFGLPTLLLVLRNFALTVRRDLIDAAKIDGCGELGIYFRIWLPLAKPVIITMLAFQFIWVWNTLLWGLVLATSPNTQPLTIGLLTFYGEFIQQHNLMAAAATTSFIIPMLIFLLTQKYLFEGFAGMTEIR